jgi:hypothetical protein
MGVGKRWVRDQRGWIWRTVLAASKAGGMLRAEAKGWRGRMGAIWMRMGLVVEWGVWLWILGMRQSGSLRNRAMIKVYNKSLYEDWLIGLRCHDLPHVHGAI